MQDDKTPGFFPLPREYGCHHPEHQPPSHLYIPPGQGYRRVCPSCGAVFTIIPQQVTM